MNEKLPTEDVLIVALVVRWTVQAVEMAAVLSGERQWCVIEADCLHVLPWLPDKSVAHVITDPPFNNRTSANARTNNNWKPQSEAHAFITFSGIDPATVAPEALRVAQRWVLAFCALEQLGAYEIAAGGAWIRAGVWLKPDGAPQFTGDRPAQAAEGIAIMHRPGKKRWNRGGGRGYWVHSVVQDRAEFGHPTPKPLPLMIDLLEDFTDPGEVILDAFAGSGTTGVAALRLGRRAILIERDPKYAAIARQRMEAEKRGQSLKEYRAGQASMFSAEELAPPKPTPQEEVAAVAWVAPENIEVMD